MIKKQSADIMISVKRKQQPFYTISDGIFISTKTINYQPETLIEKLTNDLDHGLIL